MIRRHALILPVLALAACSKPADPAAGTGASSATTTAATTAAADGTSRREAGKWEYKTELKDVVMPGMPAQAIEGMKAKMASAAAQTQCLTPEQAASEDLSRIQDNPMGGQCTYDRKSLSGGKIDLAGKCNVNGINMTLTMTGTQSAKAIDATQTMVATMPGGAGQMRTVATITGRHVGAC